MKVSRQSSGEGPAIIFLHGVGSGKEGWIHQRAPISEAGFRFIAIDAPGFGETPLPAHPGFAPHVEAILAIMDDFELDKAVLCGHSLGGMTAQEFFAGHPDRVSALVLSATSPAFGRPDGEFQKQFLEARLAPFRQGMTMPQFAKKFASKLVGPNPAAHAIEEIIHTLSGVSVEAYRLAMHTLTGFDQRGNLANINVPTLLISGAGDTNSPAPMMEKMASKIPGACYVNLAETGHMAPIETPDAFNQTLIDFLRRTNRP